MKNRHEALAKIAEVASQHGAVAAILDGRGFSSLDEALAAIGKPKPEVSLAETLRTLQGSPLGLYLDDKTHGTLDEATTARIQGLLRSGGAKLIAVEI